MLCTKGHNNPDDASFCSVCGTNTFASSVVVLGHRGAEYSGMAIASMVLGIVWLYGLGAILALVFGYLARGEIARTGKRGSGMATAGIVLGWVGIAGIVFLVFVFGAFIHSEHVPNYPVNGQ